MECRDFPLKLKAGESRNEEEHLKGYPYPYALTGNGSGQFTEEQIVKALQAVETGGKKAVDQHRELGVSNANWYIWNRKYCGLNVIEERRLREMEPENTQLKRIVANLMLENKAIKEVLYAAVAC